MGPEWIAVGSIWLFWIISEIYTELKFTALHRRLLALEAKEARERMENAGVILTVIPSERMSSLVPIHDPEKTPTKL